MCGIIGGFWFRLDEKIKSNIDAGLCSMLHRGPNDKGLEVYSSSNGEVALGHTRLSIIDLSPAGHQPMTSNDGRYKLVFNGEIYNYRELRNQLKLIGCQFHSDSDSEVLLQAWVTWGHDCLPRLVGMFAFVIYDRQLDTLTCVRDAFGIKPFFYSLDNGQFHFASEQPALTAIKGGKVEIDWQRSYDYLVHGDYDSQERTFIKGTKHLPPAHFMVFNISTQCLTEPASWWQPQFKENSTLNFDQAVEAVRSQFLENIKLHLRSDVPLGAALSGGIDSSAIVCAMQHVEPGVPIHTFSYIPQQQNLSEEKHIDLVNAHVRAISHKTTFSSDELINDLDDLIRIQGEPFGSTSIYAQYRVFKQAKEAGITVTLEGQGADELLAGYSGYPGQRLLSLLETGHPLQAISFSHKWSQFTGQNYKKSWMYLGRIVLPNDTYRRARKLLGRDFSPTWLNCDLLEEMGVNLNENRYSLTSQAKGRRVIEQLCRSLQHRGLPGLLRHSDRNSMHFSVESRVPFLTIPMAELLLSLPENYLIARNAESKHVFRAAMRGIVPDAILDRKDKIGFATPEQSILLNKNQQFCALVQKSDAIPFINKDNLLKTFEQTIGGQIKFTQQVWRWINFILWHENVTQ